MNYKTYAEAKIANPDSEIVTAGEKWGGGSEFIGIFEALALDGSVHGGELGSHEISDEAWVICNPADYCSSLKEFFDAGFELARGDLVVMLSGIADNVRSVSAMNDRDFNDYKRYILSAAALNGGCKIPAKAEQWSVYNNTLPLCELTDEQYGKMRRTHDNGATVQSLNEDGYGFQDCALPTWISNGVYRIKPKSERELFIENTTKVMRDAGTKCPDNHEYFGIMFDAGARYTDKTQFFGESI